MPPPMQRFGGAPNNLASHYQQYPHSQVHSAGLPPPSLNQPAFMNANSMNNPFAVNGNALSITGGFGGSGLGMPGGTGLASQAAQMGFANASMQQHGHNAMIEAGSRGRGKTEGRSREVWKHNLADEMANLRQLVDKYQYISMDAKFPGLVARPMGSFHGKSDYHYQCLRCNIDLLKIIQVGITLFTEDGEQPPSTSHSSDSGMDMSGARKYNGGQTPCTWQFNFQFSLKDDMYAEMSIETLKQAGLDFARLESDGIDPANFASLLISSGLVCDEDVRWISFHGGYDFGYLTKLLICQPLPDDEKQFDMYVKKFFPSIYDIKWLMKYAARQHAMGQITPIDQGTAEILAKFEQKSGVEQKSGLDNIVESFKIKRPAGNSHQAGSESLSTGRVFFKVRERIFNGEISDDHLGAVWGLNDLPEVVAPQHTTPQHYHQELQENTTPGHNGTSYGNGPSTPNTGNAGLVSTPGQNNNAGGMPLTPGGGGVFGSFQYGR